MMHENAPRLKKTPRKVVMHPSAQEAPRLVAQRTFRFGFFGSSRPVGGIGTCKAAGRRPGKWSRFDTRWYGAKKTKPRGPSRNEPPESQRNKLHPAQKRRLPLGSRHARRTHAPRSQACPTSRGTGDGFFVPSNGWNEKPVPCSNARNGAHGNVWWRCGESNSGPKHTPDGFLQAQLPVGIRNRRTWQRALGLLAGSIFSHGIPATSTRASP